MPIRCCRPGLNRSPCWGDETRRGCPRWVYDEVAHAWQAVVGRWHVGFVDLSHGQGLLGQVEGRTTQAVIDWLDARGQQWKEQVAHVAIDICMIFKAAMRAALPHAVLVVDYFYVVQLANAVVTEVRRRLTVQVRGRRGRKGNREWELHNRLTRSAARMYGSQLNPMIDDLMALPKGLGAPILAAWNAKEALLDVLALARTHPDRTVIADRLFRFYDRCAACPNSNDWRAPSRPGGPRSSPSSTPASPTPAPRAPTV